MAVKHDHKRLLSKLRKKVKVLQKKEEQSRVRLQAAIKKIRFLARDYKIKLDLNKRVMESKIAEIRKKSYKRIIEELEDMIIQGIKQRGKALTSAIEKLETKHLAKTSSSRRKKKRRSTG